ncbi:ATP-binding protein [Gracilimonas sp.]|uniref:ATP-binding protein n=1 Tax=Gracilimonas sp. TaxID=1974203 RepID=UPI003BABCCFC
MDTSKPNITISTLYDLLMKHPHQGIVYLEMDTPIRWNRQQNSDDQLEFVLNHLRVAEVNAAMLNILKTKREDVIELSIEDIIRTNIGFNKKHLLDLLSNGSVEDQKEIRLTNGDILFLKSDSICIYNDEDELTGIFSIQKDITSEVQRKNDLWKRDRLLIATSEAGNFLLREANFNKALYKVCKTLGEKLAVDRVFIFENHQNTATGYTDAKLRMKWDTTTPDFRVEPDSIPHFPIEETFPTVYHQLNKGNIAQTSSQNVSGNEQAFLEEHNIHSIFIVPIFIQDEFWGFLRFDDCSEEKDWTLGEIAILKSFSSTIGMTFERERFQNSLHESRLMFEYITENIDEVFYVRDPNMNILYINEAFEDIFGISVQATLEDSQNYTKHIHPDDLENIQKAPLDKKTIFEYRFVTPDNSIKHIANKRAPVFDSDGNIVRYVGVMMDITDIKRAQSEMEEALILEREHHDLKNRFISMISHEIRTPLTAIVSSAEMIEDFFDRLPPEKKKELNHRILGASDKILTLLEEVLLIGKSDAGKLTPEYEEINIQSFLNTLLDEIQITKTRSNAVHQSVQTENRIIILDKKLLSHILVNLLENASKYSNEGSNIWLHIDTSDRQELNIIVKDEGMGIPEEDQEKIFEPFYRAKDVSDIEGTGLGMPIIRQSVRALGGQLHLSSSPNKGSTFHVTIPITTK